ncbi:MAG: endonuclease [Aphanocapsa sp. GSE-SYN-MK-11-07L]|jgi:hypothetical protein|nr:endonuclease [Aphanocapsa sp. GSE-SYN-MK-11-07L]
MTAQNRYEQIIEHIFFSHYKDGMTEIPFTREEIAQAGERLKINLPKNLGDVVYSFRYRNDLPVAINAKAPAGLTWIIRPAGRARYRFVAIIDPQIIPNPLLAETKIPDATPGIVSMYALSDEQALLAKLRYNRLIDIFTGVTCYSLQNHLRTTVPEIGQVETDELYIGVDRRGAHYVFPVQAKGGKDKQSIVQIEQDFALCESKFPLLICRPIAAQFMEGSIIALFSFEKIADRISILSEKHYRLVFSEEISGVDWEAYRQRLSEE